MFQANQELTASVVVEGACGDATDFGATIERLLLADREGRCSNPLTADELLLIGGKAFESLFLEPPLGPIPEYLIPHLTVHNCVAEYEEVFDALDHWKACQLREWLQDQVGRSCRIAGKVYQLRAECDSDGTPEKFRLSLIDDRSQSAAPAESAPLSGPQASS